MRQLIVALLLGLVAAAACAARPPAAAHAEAAVPDSSQLEKELQGLPWKKFRSVVEAIPKLRADIEAYGPLGWQYVQAHYATYGWKKNIDKLDDDQKRQLAQLIRSARAAR
ncbi:MAG TPA: hypothetical protein VMB75_09520 [Rhodocyclaceae bacterium]|nr:hypothetical protein [Rhodocyclaceae bacterium]